MTDKRQRKSAELTEDELAEQRGEELPERAAMSVVAPEPIADTDPPWWVDDRTGDMPPNPMPFPKQSE